VRVPGLTFALVLLGAAVPAHAQSFEEAVGANMAVGLQLCLSGGNDMAAWANSFRQAGFSERVERSGSNSDTTHYFTAPADTVTVELYYGEMPEHCIVASAHLGVTGASAVVDQVVPALYPGFVRRVETGPVSTTTGQPATCVRYEDPSNPIGLVIGAAPGDGANSCVENGTSRLYQSYRV